VLIGYPCSFEHSDAGPAPGLTSPPRIGLNQHFGKAGFGDEEFYRIPV
jgi:hypothetical protein